MFDIAEPDVTLTDYGLAVECALFAVLLARLHDGAVPVRSWFLVFFAALSVAALGGGTVHGFFHDETTQAYQLIWNATLVAIGVVALSAWMIGSRLDFAQRSGRLLRWTGAGLFAVYCLIVLQVSDSFTVVIIHYLPAVLFLLYAFARSYRRSRRPYLLNGLVGLSLTLMAAGVQQLGIPLHPVYFDHNALYHLVQAVALLIIFLSARKIIRHGVGT